MKEAMGAARNLYLVANEKSELIPMIETIIITSEPRFIASKDGLVRVRKSSTLRFHIAPDTLRSLAIQFANWADEADELTKKATPQPT